MKTWTMKIKSPKFWIKATSAGAGAVLASGQVPEWLLPLFSEGVYQALGGVVAAIMAGWIGKDHKRDKKIRTKKGLMGMLLVLLVLLLLLSGCASYTYETPDGTKMTARKWLTWQEMEGFEADNLRSDPSISIQKQNTANDQLQQLLQLINILGQP